MRKVPSCRLIILRRVFIFAAPPLKLLSSDPPEDGFCAIKSIRQITPLTAGQIGVEMVQQKIRPALFQFPPESVRLAPFLRRDGMTVL